MIRDNIRRIQAKLPDGVRLVGAAKTIGLACEIIRIYCCLFRSKTAYEQEKAGCS
ncbi:MAG: hypothetical protein HN416_14475 [Nitrospina sp.]|jgi:hypothetical protein|nr:hypothetical protein [Nitrospina sp.]